MALNKVFLIGNLGSNPELRYTANNTAVCNLRLATHDIKKQQGEPVKVTEWHRVVVFGVAAENCVKYLSKGRLVFVEGKLRTRSWEDKDGNKQHSTEIEAVRVDFLGPKE